MRKTFPLLLALLFALLAAPIPSEGQPAGRVARIGFLSGSSPGMHAPILEAFRQGMRDHGYVEGQAFTIEPRYAEGRPARLPDLAAELVHLPVDLLTTIGGPAALAAKQATATIPVVTFAAGDPVGTGLVASLARPGGNVTGVTDQATELSAKRLQLLKEAVPRLSRVAVLWNSGDQAMTLRYRQVEGAAQTLGVTVHPLPVREADDFDGAFAAMARHRPDGLLLVTDSVTSLNRKRVLDFAAANRLPAMYEFSNFVNDGGLMSYGPSVPEMARRAAYFVDRIFRGAKPGDLPVEQPTRFYLVVNLKTAKALGLKIPPSILIRAEQVIQ